jgi:hypothetical protein
MPGEPKIGEERGKAGNFCKRICGHSRKGQLHDPRSFFDADASKKAGVRHSLESRSAKKDPMNDLFIILLLLFPDLQMSASIRACTIGSRSAPQLILTSVMPPTIMPSRSARALSWPGLVQSSGGYKHRWSDPDEAWSAGVADILRLTARQPASRVRMTITEISQGSQSIRESVTIDRKVMSTLG